MTETWHMGTHLRELSESYLMNTNMTGLRWFSKSLCTCSMVESSLSIERVKGSKWSYYVPFITSMCYYDFRLVAEEVVWPSSHDLLSPGIQQQDLCGYLIKQGTLSSELKEIIAHSYEKT